MLILICTFVIMIHELTCPSCNTLFEASELGEDVANGYYLPNMGGKCPNCDKSFSWNWDCNDEYNAILIPIWEL